MIKKILHAPLPRNFYKSRLSTTSSAQSQFSSKYSITYRLISVIKLNMVGGGRGVLFPCMLASLQIWKLINQPAQICLRETVVPFHYLLIFNFFFNISLQPRPRFWTQSLTKSTYLLFWKLKSEDAFQLKNRKIYFTLVTPPSVLHSVFAQQDQIRLTGCTRVATNFIFSY